MSLNDVILDTIGVLVVTFDTQGRITYFNHACEVLTGYSRDEAIGKVVWEFLIPEKYVESVKHGFASMLALKEPNSQEYPWLTRDGKTSFVSWSNRVIEDKYGNITGVAVSGVDITERMWAEEALRASEEKLRLVFECITDGIIITDLNWRIVNCNKAASHMHRYTIRELLGQNILSLVSHKEHNRVVGSLQKTLANGYSGTGEYTFLTKDGGEFLAELTAAVFKDALGNAVGLVAVIRDVTERRKMEEQLIMADRLASIGELVSGIAHELNNPLTSVIGFSELLLMHKDVPQDVREDIENIHWEAQRTANIVRGLLTFARKREQEKEPVDINSNIEKVLQLRTYEQRVGNIQVIKRFAPNLPEVMGNSHQLEQVFLNIIINAEYFMTVAHRKGTLVIATEQAGDMIRVTFSDDGPGISNENMGHLFHPFFTTKEVGQGTGLGLSICHGIITSHGGRIYAESELGRGATFIIELPLTTLDERAELTESDELRTESVAKAKILVVDDEPLILSFLGRVLGAEGYNVEIVGKATDALERIRRNMYSIILVDIKLPGMSGIELYQSIKRISTSLCNRVVFLTGDLSNKETQNFLSENKAQYIAKPFDTDELKNVIKHILKQLR